MAAAPPVGLTERDWWSELPHPDCMFRHSGVRCRQKFLKASAKGSQFSFRATGGVPITGAVPSAWTAPRGAAIQNVAVGVAGREHMARLRARGSGVKHVVHFAVLLSLK
jgi:hypothetical protein